METASSTNELPLTLSCFTVHGTSLPFSPGPSVCDGHSLRTESEEYWNFSKKQTFAPVIHSRATKMESKWL